MHALSKRKWNTRWPLQPNGCSGLKRVSIHLCVSVVLVLSLAASGVHARRETTFAYPYSRVWTSAVRLMRVDFESEITEKDKEDGYFLFAFPDRGKTYAGSMELVSLRKDGIESVRVVLTIQALPSYVENMLMDRLERKLAQEFGPPPERKPPADSGAAPDQRGPPSPAEDEDRDKGAARPERPEDRD